MADISNSPVFTNDRASSGTSDLIQQALQQVVDEEDNENDFITFLQNDETVSETIHLTPEQAIALGLTFDVSSNEEVMYHQDQNIVLVPVVQDDPTGNSISPEMVTEQLDLTGEHTQISMPNNIDFSEWTIKNDSHDVKAQEENIDAPTLNGIHIQTSTVESNDTQQQTLKFIPSNLNPQKILVEQSKVNTPVNLNDKSGNDMRYTSKGRNNMMVQANHISMIEKARTQMLQKLPVLLPSSQFIIKPPQTLLKSTQNIKLFQNNNKPMNMNANPVSATHSINTNLNSNSVLFTKTAIINTLPSQIMKTTQPLNSNNISAKLLNASQNLTRTCEIPNPNSVSIPQITNNVTNNTLMPSQNILASQIRVSPLLKNSQKGNVQQILAPMLRSSATILKNSHLLSNTMMPTTTTELLKTVPFPAQIIKALPSITAKKGTGTTAATKITGQANNSPVIFRTTSIMKAQDGKTVNNNCTSILKPTQISTPVSILKPQTKVALNNQIKSSNFVTQGAINGSKALSQIVPVTQQNGLLEGTKSLQNGNLKRKLNVSINGTCLKVNKKTKVIPTANKQVIKTSMMLAEPMDTSKPLGSDENPIQIIQQGSTFHSLQRLSQPQLKQISNLLQQRSQEVIPLTNEKILYQVVFPENMKLVNQGGNQLKNRGGKRGRPRKTAIRSSLTPPKPPVIIEEEQEELKDERKTVVARTRSGRLSRPPRHMVRDYKHLHHLDFSQPDLDDSDGGYSDYNTNNDKLEEEESPKELLSGLEVPKRKISDHFRCPTCNKIYLGRTRMARHFELFPDHGSPEQLPPSTPDPELKQNGTQDPLKRKGKKRGPWAYVTPEAKSERRQMKLKEAISVCENSEIINVATKPVIDAQPIFNLLIFKSENNVNSFLHELKELMNKIREKVGSILLAVNRKEESDKDLVDINEELLCDVLGINPGLYKMNNEALTNGIELIPNAYVNEEPPCKVQKISNSEDGKENIEERLSSGSSESSDLSVSDFLSERRNDAVTNPSMCSEVLSTLTLIRRSSSPVNNTDNNKNPNVAKLLISNPEIQNQISENSGFQKIDINATKVKNFQKSGSHEEKCIKLVNNLGSSNSSEVFCKIQNNYDHGKLGHIEQAFIKLESIDQGFVKLENGILGSYQKQEVEISNDLNSMETGNQNFAKGFQKLVNKINPTIPSDLNCTKTQTSTLDTSSSRMLPVNSVCKMSESMPILQDTGSIISNNCESNIFDSTENLDMSKMSQYDHISHLDILNTSGVIDKNLLIDEKLVEQLHLVDQSSLVDELVSERLKNIMPDTILENNLISNNSNIHLDFDALRDDFNSSIKS